MPGRFAVCDKVIQTVYLRPRQGCANGVSGSMREKIRTGGSPDLVINHCETFALPAKAQHRFREVAAPRAVNPAGTEDQMMAARAADGLFAFQLGGAVHIQGSGQVSFHPRLISTAVKY